MADVDAMVALTKKYNEGFFYPVFTIIVIALQFPLHHALEDEWQRQAYEDDWEMGNKGLENWSYKHQALCLELSPWFLLWILAQLRGENLEIVNNKWQARPLCIEYGP